MDRKDYLLLSNDELIELFKENNYSLSSIDKTYGFSRSTSERLFKKRRIDYNQIRESYIQSLIKEYNKNPKLCKQCGKPIPWDQREKDFCNKSCSNKYNNLTRGTNNNKKYINDIVIPRERAKFLEKLELKYPGRFDLQKDIVYINVDTNVELVEKETGSIIRIKPSSFYKSLTTRLRKRKKSSRKRSTQAVKRRVLSNNSIDKEKHKQEK